MTTSGIHFYRRQSSDFPHQCAICGAKSIGLNFGVLTCAPCKGMKFSFTNLLIFISFLFYLKQLFSVEMRDEKK
jgi:hypothetical protein